MRSFLIFSFVAFIVVVAVLFTFRGALRDRARRPVARTVPDAPSDPAPDRLPDVARRVRTLRHAPEVQEVLLDLVKAAARLGPAAVEDLRSRLRDQPDVVFEPRWIFEDGRPRRFATLRSAYLAALLGITGPEAHDALIEALALTGSVDEAYQIAAGLERRGEGGFTPGALERALKAGPGHVEVAQEIVTLVARADPEGTAAEIVARSPRGEDGTDPTLLAQALERLPLEHALGTGKGLLADPQVTRRAKARYLEGLCDRGEPELFASLRDVANEGFMDRDLRVTLAYRAVGSGAFDEDRIEYATAAEGAPRAGIRARYERRLAEVELLIHAAIPPGEGSGPLLESLRRQLADRASGLR